jgi:hypothetical protein
VVSKNYLTFFVVCEGQQREKELIKEFIRYQPTQSIVLPYKMSSVDGIVVNKGMRTEMEPEVKIMTSLGRMIMTWTLDDKYYRPDDQPTRVTEETKDGRNFLINEWLVGSDRSYHRDGDQPAYQKYIQTGAGWSLICQCWYQNNKISRIGGPALVTYADGKAKTEEWCLDGKWHNPKGPSRILLYAVDGVEILERTWHINGQLHCLCGPAYEKYENGTLVLEQCYIDDVLEWSVDHKMKKYYSRSEA